MVPLAKCTIFALVKYLLLYLVLISLWSEFVSSKRLDCCSKDLAANGIGCTAEGVTFEGSTSYCVVHDSICSLCLLANSSVLHECVMCCVQDYSCEDSYVSDSSWALICVIFAGSCCCCSIVFMSAEHSRVKEGMSFQEAYLIPIPIVAVDMHLDGKDCDYLDDQPTAIATAHNNIDIPVAEPTEHSAFLGFYPERDYVWD